MKFPSTSRFRIVHIDIVGPLIPSSTGKRFILTMMDRFTRWPHAVPISNISAPTVARVFYYSWVCNYGCPDVLISDQGKQFESDVFNELLKALDVKRVRTTPYHPQSNGLIERFHLTLKNVLR